MPQTPPQFLSFLFLDQRLPSIFCDTFLSAVVCNGFFLHESDCLLIRPLRA